MVSTVAERIEPSMEPNLPSYYHQYAVANIDHPDKIIEGLHLIFVELTKFKPQSFSEKKMQVLWLRFLTEMGGASKVPQEFLDNPEVKKAVDILEESSYTPAQLEGYDKFWDIVHTERTYYKSAHRHGYAEGKEEGYKKGWDKGREEGREEGALEEKKKCKWEEIQDILEENYGKGRKGRFEKSI